MSSTFDVWDMPLTAREMRTEWFYRRDEALGDDCTFEVANAIADNWKDRYLTANPETLTLQA